MAVVCQALHPLPQSLRRQSLHQPSYAIPESLKRGMNEWDFLSPGKLLLKSHRAQNTFILVQSGFEQNKVDLTRDAACGCARHALRGLQGPKSLLHSAYQLRPLSRRHQLVRCKPFANCSARRVPFYKLPPRAGAFSSLHEGTSVSINPGNSSSHHKLSSSSLKTFLPGRPAAAAR